MSVQREDTITPVTTAELLNALRLAWFEAWGNYPKHESLLVLLSQITLETGWMKSCHNWNVGNIKHVPGDGRDYTYFRCNEVIKGKLVWFDPPHPACCFRAYTTLQAGVRDFLLTLHRNFQTAWDGVEAGDPAQFSKLLKESRYYTADEAKYTAGLVSLFKQFTKQFPDPAIAVLRQEQIQREVDKAQAELQEMARNAIRTTFVNVPLMADPDNGKSGPPFRFEDV